MGNVRISPSMVKDYEKCPRLYKFRYIDKLPRQITPLLFVGTVIHSSLKELYLLPESSDKTKEVLEKILRKIWSSSSDRKKVFKTAEEEKFWGIRALSLIENFIVHFHPLHTPYRLEEYHEVSIKENVIFYGRIDRIDIDEENKLHIYDYKIGSSPKDAESFISKDIQLGMYGMMIRKKFLRDVVEGSYLFLSDGKKLTIPFTADYMTYILSYVEKVVERLQREKDFLPRVSNLCPYCDFIELCPEGKEKSSLNSKEEFIDELPF
jgi:putative RecB family exonuclease